MKTIARPSRDPQTAPRALIVEPHDGMRTFLAGVSRAVGLEVQEVDSAEAARLQLALNDYDLVITELDLPQVDGFALIAEIGQTLPPRRRPRIVVCSAQVDSPAARRREELDEADALLSVPTTAIDLISAIQRALHASEV